MKNFTNTNWVLGVLFFVGLFSLLFRATWQTAAGWIVVIMLIGAGSALAVYNVNRIAKSNNPLKAKIYFSVVFSLFLSILVLFFWFIGSGPLGDEFGLGTLLLILPSAGIILLVGLITGVTRSIQMKGMDSSSINVKALNTKLTVIIVILIFIIAYNPLVANFAKASRSASLCSLSAEFSENSAMFHSGLKNNCIVTVAKTRADENICNLITDGPRFSDAVTGCYIAVAVQKSDTAICRKGIEHGLAGMDSCISIVTQSGQTKAVAADLESGVSICENSGQCNALVDMDSLIFSTLNDPRSPDIIYATKATKYLYKDGQKERAIPLLRSLLVGTSLDVRRQTLDSLLYIAGSMLFDDEKSLLSTILPVIKSQADLEDYTLKIEQRLSAKLLVPNASAPYVPAVPKR